MISKRFEVLDSFRGLCALCVVVNHMRFTDSITELDFFRHAGLFVDFFFVLSGFVLTHSYAYKDDLSFKSFLVSRTFRLYPLHLATFLAVILLELVKLAMYQKGYTFNTVPFTEMKATKEIIPNLLLIQAWSSHSNPLSFNAPSWSISIEYYTYMIFFATLFFFSKVKVIAWVAISTLVFLSGTFNLGLLVPFAQKGLLCFFAGAFVYFLYRRYIRYFSLSAAVATVLEICTLIAVVWIVSSDISHLGIYASLLFSLSVLLFSLEAGAVSRALKRQLFQYLGKLSYSIYMTHAPILFYFTAFILVVEKVMRTNLTIVVGEERCFSMSSSDLLNNVVIAVLCLIVVFVSHFTYKYIEISGLQLGKKLQ